jgi:hypothetical protein
MMDSKDNNIEPSTSCIENKQEGRDQKPIQTDWKKMIGKTIVSKDGLDMGKVIIDADKDYQTSYSISIGYGDRERFSVPKDTIYKFDDKNLYTTLTENAILASRKDDPFSTTMRSYTHD